MKCNYLIFLAVAIFVTCHCSGQKAGFYIKGTLTGELFSIFQTDSIFLYDQEKRVLARSPLVNGTFELRGSVSQPASATLVTGEEAGIGRLILENADYIYTCENNSVIIKGGILNDMVLGSTNTKEYNDAVFAYERTMDSLMTGKTYDDLTPEEHELINKKADDAIAVESRSFIKVLDDPKAPVLAKAFAIASVQLWEKYPLEKKIALLKNYEKESGYNTLITQMRVEFEKMQEMDEMQKSVGDNQKFKDIEAMDVNGHVVKLSDVIAKNKYTLLEFWASWCGPCRGEIPNLKEAYAKYKSKGFEIYAVSLDNNKDAWLKALKEENTPWLNLKAPKDFDGEAAKEYGVSGIPASFLVGQDGIIRVSNKQLRGKELEETLNKYMP